MSLQIAIVTTNPGMSRTIEGTINSTKEFKCARVHASLDELVQSSRDGALSAVVVDLDPSPGDVLTALKSLIARWPATRFVVVGREQRERWLLQAMEAGVRQYLTTDMVADELLETLRRITEGSRRESRQGSIVTILSAGGGSGATTLAANLAQELSLVTSERVLAVDLDDAYGAMAHYLGLKPDYTIADVLSYDGEIDGHLIESTAVPYGDRLDVLMNAATRHPIRRPEMGESRMGEVLDACRQMYRYTVVDAPRQSRPCLRMLVERSSMLVLILQLNVIHVTHAARMLEELAELGVSPSTIVVVINRWRKKTDAGTFKECQRLLGGWDTVQISNDFKTLMSAINAAKPLSVAGPRSIVRKEIRALAERIVNETRASGWTPQVA